MAELKGNRLKLRLSNYDKWSNSVEERLNIVLSKYSFLDFTPSSLETLEKLLLEEFKDPMVAYQLDNADFFDSVSTYIGEVYIRNLPLQLKWDVSLESPKNKDSFAFLYFINGDSDFTGFNPFSRIPFALNIRSGDKLLSHYTNLEKVKLNVNTTSNSQSFVPPNNGFSYHNYLMFKNSLLTLEYVKLNLNKYYSIRSNRYSIVIYNNSRLILHLDNKYNFHFDLDVRDNVIEESREIAANYKGEKKITGLEYCNSRIEFWGDEDPNGEYINEYMFILEEFIQDSIYIFDIRNGIFFDEF